MANLSDTDADTVQLILSDLDDIRTRLTALTGPEEPPVEESLLPDLPQEFLGQGDIKHVVRSVVNDAIKPVKSAVNRVESAIRVADKDAHTVASLIKVAGESVKAQGQAWTMFLGQSKAIQDKLKMSGTERLGAALAGPAQAAFAINTFGRLTEQAQDTFAATVSSAGALAEHGLAMEESAGADVKAEIKAVTGDLKSTGEAVVAALGTHVPAFKKPAKGAASAERQAYDGLLHGVDTATTVLDKIPDAMLAPIALAVPKKHGGKRFDLVRTATDALRNAAEALKKAGQSPALGPGFAESPAEIPVGLPAGAQEAPSDAEISVKAILYGLGLIGTAVTGFLDWVIAAVPLTLAFEGEAGLAVALKGGLGIGSDLVSLTAIILGATSALLAWLIAAMQAFPLDLIFS